jgi:hypothetical protein
MSITSQTGGEFSGRTNWQGNGASSDPYCSHSGTFAAVMTQAGTLTELRLDPPMAAKSCARVSGDGVFTGTVTSDSAIEGQMMDRVSCVDELGRPYEADRTVTFNVRKR